MIKRLLYIVLLAVFIFPLLFQPLHVILHHFGQEHVHHSNAEPSLFNHQAKCSICHYELIYNAFLKIINCPWLKQAYTEKNFFEYSCTFKFELSWFNTSRAPPY